jgi:hypothetical protein
LKPGLTSWLEHNARANPARLHPLDLYRRAYPRIVHLWDRAGGTRTMSRAEIWARRGQAWSLHMAGPQCVTDYQHSMLIWAERYGAFSAMAAPYGIR